jgi:hypothetical protein
MKKICSINRDLMNIVNRFVKLILRDKIKEILYLFNTEKEKGYN